MPTITQILTEHERGILSVSWYHQDVDLLLSCGKGNRALRWNSQTSEIIGEVFSFYSELIDIISYIVTASNSRQLGIPGFLVSTESRAPRNGIPRRYHWDPHSPVNERLCRVSRTGPNSQARWLGRV